MTTSFGPGGEFGNYTIDSVLGRGGMSVVYLAEDRRLGRQVAIKVLAEELAEDESFRTRFIRESQLAAGLEHPNIVPVYEAGELDAHLFIAMRYVRGTDLRTLISREGPLDAPRTLELIRPVAAALDAAHRRGLVHRDVKPANILLAVDEGEEHPYLSDFGLTKHTASKSGLTKTGQFMGTVDYVAPEQIKGEEVDGRTDEYSLACVVYQCLTGSVPFDKPADVATMFGHLQDPPPTVSALRPDLPREVDEVVTRGMAKDREDRFPTCTAMMQALTAAVGLESAPRDQPTFDPTIVAMPPQPGSGPMLPPAPEPTPSPEAAPVPGRPAPAGKPAGARRGLLIGGAVAVVAIVGVIAALALGGGDEPGPGPQPTGAAGPTAPAVAEFANGTTIQIPGGGIAAPYPSTIQVAGVEGTIAEVTVTLHGFGHEFPRDVDLVLAGPQGQTVMLMEGTGGPGEATDVTVTFDDDGPPMTLDDPLTSGTNRPTSEAGDGFGFNGPPPVPEPPYGASLSVFDGTDPNGAWNLFLFDDSEDGTSVGQVAGGWTLSLELTAGGGVTGATAPTGATGGAVVFADDFSDPSSGWDVFDERQQHGLYRNGEYVLGVAASFQVAGDFNTSTEELASLTDVRIEATGRLLTATRDALYGLVCRAADPSTYYYFLIGGNGKFFIGENDVDSGASNFDVGVSPAIAKGTAVNRISLECVDGPGGVTIRAAVNGSSVNTIVDGERPIRAGGTGFLVESGDADMEAAFDDFVVTRVEPVSA